MKLNMILFALVCLGLLALALAHDGECAPAQPTKGGSSVVLVLNICTRIGCTGEDHSSKNDHKARDWDWEDDKDQDCKEDDDDKEEGQCYWKCVKVCHKKNHHTTSTTRKHTTSTTKECPKETTSTTRKHTTTTEECPKETTSTTRKHTTSTTKGCTKETTSTTRKHCEKDGEYKH
jgi:hypothetical protein